MRSIPVALRQRIIHLYEQKKSTREIAEYLGFCVAAVRRVRQQFKARGTLATQTHLCGRKTLLTVERKASRLTQWPTRSAPPTRFWPAAGTPPRSHVRH